MLTIEKTVLPSPEQWEIIIEGMRNPKNSWDRMDSQIHNAVLQNEEVCPGVESLVYKRCEPYISIGPNDHKLMDQLNAGGPVHAKYRRMIPVYVTLTAPLYFLKEADTYKVGTVCNSCSTMHKIQAKEFVIGDFSSEHLTAQSMECLRATINELNRWRDIYLNGGMVDSYDGTARVYEPKDKDAWWQMIQLLPTSYNQKRTYMFNYETLVGIYKWRRNHKLDCWHTFCSWIEQLPYSELITGGVKEDG